MKRIREALGGLFLIGAILFGAPEAWADCPDQSALPANSVCVEWQAPTQNVDNSPIPVTGPGSIASYTLYWGFSAGDFDSSRSLVISDPDLREFTGTISIPRPPGGGDVDVFLVLTATNTTSEESAYSNQVARVITFPAPVTGEPTILDVIINIEFT